MLFLRSSALRASSIARFARPARGIRITEPQPWQRLAQRSAARTYASASGSHAPKKAQSEFTWLAGAIVGTAIGGYFVVNQDLGGGHHDEHHEKHEEAHEEGDEAPAEDTKAESKEEPKEEDTQQEATESAKKEGQQDKSGEEKSAGAEDPSNSDKPDPRKEPAGKGEMSAKQEHLANEDTKHPTEPGKSPDKSKKGEGVAETSKVKGTVSTERPQTENKEERGKDKQDKSQ